MVCILLQLQNTCSACTSACGTSEKRTTGVESNRFLGSRELGLVYAFVAVGVFLAFRVLDFPDLTVDGSFPLGAAVTAVLIIAGVNPWLAAAVAMVAGAAAGMVTALLNVRFKILNLLASILTMIALFSVNLRVMGKPNVALINADTMLSPFYGLGLRDFYVRPLFVGILVAFAVVLVWRFLESDAGLAMRATAPMPAWRGHKGSTPAGRSISAWRSPTRSSPSAVRSLPRPTVLPT